MADSTSTSKTPASEKATATKTPAAEKPKADTSSTPSTEQTRTHEDHETPGGAAVEAEHAPQEQAKSKTAEVQRAVVESVKTTDPMQSPAVIPTAGTGPDAQLLRVDDELPEALYSDAAGEAYVTIQADVVEEFFFPLTVRPSHKTKWTKGTVVRRSEVEQYNADVRRVKLLRDNDGVDPANPAGIDATTIAAGTVVSQDSDQAKAIAAGR